MTRSHSVRFRSTTAVALAALLGGNVPVHAQTSEARIKELLKEAAGQSLGQIAAPAPTLPLAGEDGPAIPLTLDEAVKFALDRNLDIAVQRLNPQLQDIAIASARTAFAPTITSTVSRSQTTSAPTSQLQLAQGGGGVVSNTFNYSGQVNKNMPWGGGSFNANLQNSRRASNSNNSTFNPAFESTWTLSYEQPLLRGFSIDSPRQQLIVSQISRDISEVQLRASLINTVSNVRNAYWDLVYATQAVDVARQSVQLATKLVEDNTVRVEVGTMAPLDIVTARSQEASSQQTLVSAENNRRTAELALKRLIVSGTEDPNWSATLNPTDRPDFNPEPVDVEAALKRALAERTDIDIIKRNLERNDVSLSLIRNNTLPEVNLNVNYGVQGAGGTRLVRSNSGVLGSEINQVIPGGIQDALAALFRRDNPRWTVGVSVNYPIGTSAQDAALARSQVQLTQIRAQIKQAELQIATEITNAAIQLRNTAESVRVAQAARELQEQRLAAEQSKFEVGMSTNYLVVLAQRDLTESRNSELRAILNYRKAQVDFERVQQSTLQNSNITLL
jgi:outer membrane protein TolC